MFVCSHKGTCADVCGRMPQILAECCYKAQSVRQSRRSFRSHPNPRVCHFDSRIARIEKVRIFPQNDQSASGGVTNTLNSNVVRVCGVISMASTFPSVISFNAATIQSSACAFSLSVPSSFGENKAHLLPLQINGFP